MALRKISSVIVTLFMLVAMVTPVTGICAVSTTCEPSQSAGPTPVALVEDLLAQPLASLDAVVIPSVVDEVIATVDDGVPECVDFATCETDTVTSSIERAGFNALFTDILFDDVNLEVVTIEATADEVDICFRDEDFNNLQPAGDCHKITFDDPDNGGPDLSAIVVDPTGIAPAVGFAGVAGGFGGLGGPQIVAFFLNIKKRPLGVPGPNIGCIGRATKSAVTDFNCFNIDAAADPTIIYDGESKTIGGVPNHIFAGEFSNGRTNGFDNIASGAGAWSVGPADEWFNPLAPLADTVFTGVDWTTDDFPAVSGLTGHSAGPGQGVLAKLPVPALGGLAAICDLTDGNSIFGEFYDDIGTGTFAGGVVGFVAGGNGQIPIAKVGDLTACAPLAANSYIVVDHIIAEGAQVDVDPAIATDEAFIAMPIDNTVVSSVTDTLIVQIDVDPVVDQKTSTLTLFNVKDIDGAWDGQDRWWVIGGDGAGGTDSSAEFALFRVVTINLGADQITPSFRVHFENPLPDGGIFTNVAGGSEKFFAVGGTELTPETYTVSFEVLVPTPEFGIVTLSMGAILAALLFVLVIRRKR